VLALYVRRAADALHELSALPEAAAALSEPETVVFAEDARLGPHPAGPRSVYSPPAPGAHERIVVSPALRLFRGPWAQALVRRLNAGLAGGGSIVLPFDARPRPGLSPPLDWWRQLFRQDGRVVAESAGRGHVELARAADLPAAPSLLDWIVAEAPRLAHELVALGGRPEEELQRALRETCADFARSCGRAEPADRAFDRSADLDVDGALELVGYWSVGLSYKAPILARIVREQFRGRRDLRHADVGGGPGWLAAELLLDEELGIERALSVDLSARFALLARGLVDAHADRLEGRLELAVGPMQSCEYGGAVDVVSFIGGTLCFLPDGDRRPVVERAWSALRPGGILVVLENIRAPRYVRDRDLMFEAAELDRLLGAFGPIRYVSAIDARSLARPEVGDRTVFRVVEKAAGP
jgi:SAM-dependent methyltransferase